MKSSYRKLCAVTAVICGTWFVLRADQATNGEPIGMTSYTTSTAVVDSLQSAHTLVLGTDQTRKIAINFKTGAVTIVGYPDMDEAARDFWQKVEAVYPMIRADVKREVMAEMSVVPLVDGK